MKILIDINHPADVHQFKNLIKIMQKKGHVFQIIARDKDCTHELLRKEKIKFIPREGYKNLIGKFFGILLIDLFLLNQACKFKPDILVGSSGNCYVSHVSKLIGKPSLVFDDTEHSKLQNFLTFPFATKIITPNCYTLKLGEKQIRYNGYKELAYLSPAYFKPNRNILRKYNIKGKYFVVRFVSWDASHDLGEKGSDINQIVGELERYGKIIISSEAKLPKKFSKYLVKDPPDLHSLLYFADLFIGEGASTATEAAILGTPAIYVNKLKLGYIDELERYGLLFHIPDEKKAVSKATKLIETKSKQSWRCKRDKLLSDKIDVNQWMFNLIKKYA